MNSLKIILAVVISGSLSSLLTYSLMVNRYDRQNFDEQTIVAPEPEPKETAVAPKPEPEEVCSEIEEVCQETEETEPAKVVRAFYADSVWQADSRYFSEDLLSLLQRDKKCIEKLRGVCAINFDIRSASQDATHSQSQILAFNEDDNTVLVEVTNQGMSTDIVYDMTFTPDGWRIFDIRYGSTSLTEDISQELDRLEKEYGPF